MEVVLLGTAAAPGWPQPSCTCASCQAQRASGEERAPTAVLVDGARLAGGEWRDIAGADGRRLLYLPLAGPVPPATLAAVAGAAYDLVLLGHDPAHFPAAVSALRDVGAIVNGTDVVAVHLDHRCPPAAELSRRLAAWGARIVPDGSVLRVGETAPVRAPVAPHRALVIGGARSGKSAEAERRLAAARDVIYVATGGAREDDPEWVARVAAHRARRPASWRTVETLDVARVVGESVDPVLVDCLTLWLAAVLDECGAWSDDVGDAEVARLVDARLDALVAAWRSTRARVVAVTNEVGSGIVPATASGRRFRDALGRLNQLIAAESDEVVLVVAGQCLTLRGAPKSPS